jgi:hypothetical protein
MCRELWKGDELNLDTDKVNFYYVKQQFKKEFKDIKITQYLQTINDSEWFKYLNGERNRVEHGQLLMIEFRGDTGKLIIADDQNAEREQILTNKNYEPVNWCEFIFEKTCEFINYCCNDLDTLLYGKRY